MVEVVLAFARGDMSEGRAEIRPEGLARPRGGPPRQGFELRKHLLNGIEVGTVRREKPQGGPPLFNQLRTDRILVNGEIIEDDEIPGAERRA